MIRLEHLGMPRVPGFLRPAFLPPQDSLTQDWMLRNNIDEEGIIVSAWSAFLLTAILGIVVVIMMLLTLGPLECVAGSVVAIVSPFLMSSRVSNRPAKMAKRESLSYLRHAPTVIGAMAMSMNVSASLERAILLASRSSSNPLSRRMSHVSWGVLTRSWPDVESALADLANSLGQANVALRQSLYLFTASTHEPTRNGMEQLMEKAHDISLQGLKDAADRYVAGLSTPVMTIFALGILLPIMLLSIVPIFTLASPLPDGASIVGSSSPPLAPMAFLILVVIPLCCVLYCRSILDSSPLADLVGFKFQIDLANLWPWLLWLSILAGHISLIGAEKLPYLTLTVIAMPPALILWSKSRLHARARKDAEGDFILGLYQIGNRLSAGASLEKAMMESAGTRTRSVFADWCSLALHRASTSRKPLEEAMSGINPVPERPLVAEAYRTVAECASSDGVAAGRIAVRLAKSLGQIKDCENGVKERMRGVIDMMRSTSLIFAPIVLGVTVGLFGITNSFSGSMEATDWVTLLAGVYVIELALVVTYLTTFIVENRGWGQFAASFATRMPLAVMAFILVSLASRAGFGQWW